MRRPALILLLLCAGSLALTGWVLRQDALRGRDQAKSALAVLLGDGRRLFANHFLAKADAYFHRGRYPSLFEVAEKQAGNHLVESLGSEGGDAGHVQGPECDHSAGPGEEAHAHDEACEHAEPSGGPDDWIARLAARFEPDRHVHLEGDEDKEMLPWVKLAVEMDPHNVDAYAVGGYWLREMGKTREAEAFLREAQRNNPDSCEIYFELGRLTELTTQDWGKAGRLYRLALVKWQAANAKLEKPDLIALAQILGRSAKVHEAQGEYEAALQDYTLLKRVSPSPEAVQRLIDQLQKRMAEVRSPKSER
ncbi:MAG: hypothetical protein MUE94_05505 [Verrucomicrobia bacterium]|jgi:tetratricopeptide (TPR) repeat protein|nr:hypothetical protein [Verrucomicrobiota bacterium]